MVIHHLLDNFEIGGAETLVLALSRDMVERGHSVTIHGLSGGGPLMARAQASSISVATYEPCSPTAPLRAFYRLNLMRKLYSAFRSAKPAVVHCHNATPTIMGAPSARAAGVPCIISTRHSVSSHRARLERKFWASGRFCQKVIGVTEAARKSLSEDPWANSSKLGVIDNGTAVPSTQRADNAASIQKDGFTLVTVGRVAPPKNFSGLLDSVAIAAKSVPDLRLWIVGDGELRADLEVKIKELQLEQHVQLLGMRSDVGYVLAQADLFVLSSVREGLPIALLEAMALNIPALVTDVGGMPDVVKGAGCGFVVPPADPEAMAEAIVNAAMNRSSLPALGAAGKQAYEDRFTLAQTSTKYLDLYSQYTSNP